MKAAAGFHRQFITSTGRGQACECRPFGSLAAQMTFSPFLPFGMSRRPFPVSFPNRVEKTRAIRQGRRSGSHARAPVRPTMAGFDPGRRCLLFGLGSGPAHSSQRVRGARTGQYQIVGRWQPLELRQPLKLANEQQQLLRLEMRRDINFAGAYIDCLYLNVYGGPGRTEVWMDDLEIGPVLEDVASPATSPGSAAPSTLTGSKESGRPLKGRRASAVEMNQDRLLVNGKRFFPRAIRHSDTPLSALRDAGFNTVYFDSATPQALVDQAVDLGFWVVPALSVARPDSQPTSAETLTKDVQKFLLNDAVLYWDLGGGLRTEQKDAVNGAARAIRAIDPQRPLTADIWDGFADYSLSLDLLGVHRWPLSTTL